METPGSVLRLGGFVQVTQPGVCHHILFSKLDFFFMVVFETEIIRKSVLT